MLQAKKERYIVYKISIKTERLSQSFLKFSPCSSVYEIFIPSAAFELISGIHCAIPRN